jgi:hypothetical protein
MFSSDLTDWMVIVEPHPERTKFPTEKTEYNLPE